MFFLKSLGVKRLVKSVKLLPLNIKLINPIQKYPYNVRILLYWIYQLYSNQMIQISLRKIVSKSKVKLLWKSWWKNITTVDICYLKYPLSRTFSSVPSALLVSALINSFGISNSAISKFHYVKLFFHSLQCFLGLFSIPYLESFAFTHSNVERIYSKTQHKNMSVKWKLNINSLGNKCQA